MRRTPTSALASAPAWGFPPGRAGRHPRPCGRPGPADAADSSVQATF